MVRYFVCLMVLAAPGLCGCEQGWAQERPTPNTLALDAGAARPPATIGDVVWIAGHWQGDGLGGFNEEVWVPPQGGTMMGMYKLVREGRIAFYELLTLVEEEGSLTLMLKHFDPDLTGWEGQDEVVVFPLVKLEPDAAYFDGMTFQQVDDDSMRVYVAIGQKDGSVREETFVYHRVQP